MPRPELIIEAIEPAEGDPQLNIAELEFNGALDMANHFVRNCFLLKIRKTHQHIILKILLGPSDQTRGHSDLSDHYRLIGYSSAGGGMLWTTSAPDKVPTLHIGSHSERFYSVPPEILEHIKMPIAEALRMSGAQFRKIILCTTEEPHPIWKEEPYCQLLNR